MPDMMGAGMTGMAGWMTGLMFVVTVLVIGLPAALIVWGMRTGRMPGKDAAADAPLAILKRRYARGDIGAAEYERIRAAIVEP